MINIKVRMLTRFGAPSRKMEKGLIYTVDQEFAVELIKAGLAEIIIDKPIIEKPIHITAKEIGKARTRSGRFMPKSKVE